MIDLPTSWGSAAYRAIAPALDELPVVRLRAAGGVLIGKTNVPEFTSQGQTANLAAEAGHDRLVADAGADAEPIPDLEFDQTLRL